MWYFGTDCSACKEWIVVPLLQTQLALEERASQTKTKFSMPMSRKAARLHSMLSACRVALPAEFKAHVTHCAEQKAVPLQAQPATQELPSWAQTNFSLPMASEAARSRHALLPTMSSARRVTPASTASMGPLYPSFDSSPVAPIDYGPAHAAQQQAQQQALPPPPSAPPMPQHVRPPCSSPTLLLSLSSCSDLLCPSSGTLLSASQALSSSMRQGHQALSLPYACQSCRHIVCIGSVGCYFCWLLLSLFQSPRSELHRSSQPLKMSLYCSAYSGCPICWMAAELMCNAVQAYSQQHAQHPASLLDADAAPQPQLDPQHLLEQLQPSPQLELQLGPQEVQVSSCSTCL